MDRVKILFNTSLQVCLIDGQLYYIGTKSLAEIITLHNQIKNVEKVWEREFKRGE